MMCYMTGKRVKHTSTYSFIWSIYTIIICGFQIGVIHCCTYQLLVQYNLQYRYVSGFSIFSSFFFFSFLWKSDSRKAQLLPKKKNLCKKWFAFDIQAVFLVTYNTKYNAYNIFMVLNFICSISRNTFVSLYAFVLLYIV